LASILNEQNIGGKCQQLGHPQQVLAAGQRLYKLLFIVKVAYNYGHWQDLLADSLDVS
jgi:hypothetical protein